MTLTTRFPDPLEVPLGELLCDVQSGFASGDRAVDGVIQIRMNNVTTNGNLDWTSFIRVPATEKQIEKYQLQPKDVLFNSTNSPELVGKTTIFEGHTEPVVFSNHFIRLRVDKTRLDARFLARWFTYQWQQRTFEGLCTQWVNQATVRKDDLLALPLPLPPLGEQKHIAAILSKADRLRRLRRYARELSDGYLQSVFLEMFGDPVSNPRGWEVHPLRSISDKFSDGPFGSNLKTEHYTEMGIRVIRLQNIGVGEIIDNDKAYISASHFANLSKYRCVPGDIIVGTLGDPNLRACILPDYIPVALNKADCVQIRVNPQKALAEFICWLLNLPHTLHLATGMLHGQTRVRISMGQLAQLEVPIPPLPLQQKFSQIVQKTERLRAQQRESARQGEHLFQSLLHRAFRGEL
jgi:type I restriction enzyme S subunit